MPFLGIFNVKSKISGSWEPSPTARPWAEMKECRGAAGRWDATRSLFSEPNEMSWGRGQGRRGSRTSQWEDQQKRHFFGFLLRGPFPCCPAIPLFWAPFSERRLSSQVFYPRMLKAFPCPSSGEDSPTLRRPPAAGPSISLLAACSCYLLSFESGFMLFPLFLLLLVPPPPPPPTPLPPPPPTPPPFPRPGIQKFEKIMPQSGDCSLGEDSG